MILQLLFTASTLQSSGKVDGKSLCCFNDLLGNQVETLPNQTATNTDDVNLQLSGFARDTEYLSWSKEPDIWNHSGSQIKTETTQQDIPTTLQTRLRIGCQTKAGKNNLWSTYLGNHPYIN